MSFEDGYDYDSFFENITEKIDGMYDPDLLWITVEVGKYVVEIAADADTVSVSCLLDSASLSELEKFNGRGHSVFTLNEQRQLVARAIMPMRLGQGWDMLVEKEVLAAFRELSMIVKALS